MATVGKNILGNLTTGMYTDSRMMYREYIQNSCDQIDKAIEEGILKSKEDGIVEINLNPNKSYICIRDNATGVMAEKFISDLGDIANSDKKIGQNRGFRGIGRLIGLAYCKTLKFTTSWPGECVKSIMTCNGELMKTMLENEKKYTLDEVWDSIVNFSTEDEDENEHYFMVELIDVYDTAKDLMTKDDIADYLSFTAPVAYTSNFFLRSKIYEHAKEIKQSIDEYNIRVNGKPIFKEYTPNIKEMKGSDPRTYDRITDIAFKDFTDSNGNLLAWMWFGISGFIKAIPSCNRMKGLRLRSGNIQVGDADTLQKNSFFKENRAHNYFVGEVFAVSDKLVPNSQRDYFNQNETRLLFENIVKDYFFNYLHNYYTKANKIKKALEHKNEFAKKVNDYNTKKENNDFIDKAEEENLLNSIAEKGNSVNKENKWVETFKEKNADDTMSTILDNLEKRFNHDEKVENKQKTTPKKESKMPANKKDEEKTKQKKQFFSSSLTKLNRREQKLVSKILSIVSDVVDEEEAKEIKERIKDEFC